MRKTILIVLMLFYTLPFLAQNTWYIAANGSGNGTSWSLASNDLQQIIDNATAGDEIWIKQGVYQREVGLAFSIKNGVSLYGGFPEIANPTQNDRNPNLYQTILEGNQNRVLEAIAAFVNGISSNTIIDGFTLRNGNALTGAGLYAQNCNATFRNLKILDNTSSVYGAGVNLSNSSATFIQVLISNNTSVLTPPHNEGDSAGLRINGGSSEFYNCVVADNHAQGYIGGVGIINANCYFYNSIIYGNTADMHYVGTYSNDNYLANQNVNFYASNCILQGCGGSEYSYQNSQFVIYGIDMGGNLDIDPQFNSDYSTQNTLSINKGNTQAYLDVLTNTDKDFFNNNRIVDLIDIGLSEYQIAQSEILYVKQNATGDGSSWENASGNLQLMMDRQLPGREVWVAEGTYYASEPYFKLREGVKVYGGFPSSDNPQFEDRNSEEYETILTSNLGYIMGNFHPESRKLSSETLLDGVIITKNENSPVAMYGVFEMNSNATYFNVVFRELDYSAYYGRETNNHFINCRFLNNHTIYLEGATRNVINLHTNAASTFTDCLFEGNYTVNTPIRLVNNSYIEVNNCIFKDNNNYLISTLPKVMEIWNSSATINTSVFDNNGFEDYEGSVIVINGVAIESIPDWTHPVAVTINKCIFKNNKNRGIEVVGKVSDTISVSNSLFYKNIAYAGAGILKTYEGSLYVTNCTFTQNHAFGQWSGGLYINTGEGKNYIRNTILYGNTSVENNDNQEVYRISNPEHAAAGIQELSFQNCIIKDSGGSSSWDSEIFDIDLGDNLDINPHFFDIENDNYRLSPQSPAINVGNTSFFQPNSVPDLSLFLTDLDGNNRIVDTIIDMGAYEFDVDLSVTDLTTTINNIKLYPNPTSSYIYFDMEDEKIKLIKIYSIQGRELSTTYDKYANLSNLSKGIYIVLVQSTDGKIMSAKVIKE